MDAAAHQVTADCAIGGVPPAALHPLSPPASETVRLGEHEESVECSGRAGRAAVIWLDDATAEAVSAGK
jgi:hypothetical protein